MSEPGKAHRPWTFLTTHAHVLLAVAAAPDARVADVAAEVGISIRMTLSILADLVAAGYVAREPRGRRTHYTVDPSAPFRHPSIASHQVGELLDLLAADSAPRQQAPGTGSDGAARGEVRR